MTTSITVGRFYSSNGYLPQYMQSKDYEKHNKNYYFHLCNFYFLHFKTSYHYTYQVTDMRQNASKYLGLSTNIFFSFETIRKYTRPAYNKKDIKGTQYKRWAVLTTIQAPTEAIFFFFPFSITILQQCKGT